MDYKKLRAKAEFILHHVPDEHLEAFVAGMEKLSSVIGREERDAMVERIIRENHGLFKRLAEWPEGERK